jgi:hypothetical protein
MMSVPAGGQQYKIIPHLPDGSLPCDSGKFNAPGKLFVHQTRAAVLSAPSRYRGRRGLPGDKMPMATSRNMHNRRPRKSISKVISLVSP